MSTEPITQALERLELAGAWHRAARARQISVPQIELMALEHLEASGGLSPGDLGHRLGLTSGGVTALTGRLMDAGYIARERHPDDGRMRVLRLSEAGAERLREHMAPVREPVEDGLAAVADADAELVAEVLDRLSAEREEAAAATPGPERLYPTDGYTRALLM
jgi:DNA-binding MarR family transcriptional regulator